MSRTETDEIFQSQRIESVDDFHDRLRCIGAAYGYWPLVGFLNVRISKYLSTPARRSAYIEFDIPQKTGGARHIVAPNAELKEELSEQIPSAEVRNMICSLCTIPTPDGAEVLPQGAPTSPVLSNIVLKRIDRRLSAFAGAQKIYDRDFSNGVPTELKSVIRGKEDRTAAKWIIEEIIDN